MDSQYSVLVTIMYITVTIPIYLLFGFEPEIFISDIAKTATIIYYGNYFRFSGYYSGVDLGRIVAISTLVPIKFYRNYIVLVPVAFVDARPMNKHY